MNKVSIACPSCQKRLKVSPKLHGKKGKCPGCQNPMVIQIPEAPVMATPVEPQEFLPADDQWINGGNQVPPAAPLPPQLPATQRTFKKKTKRAASKEENDWSCVGWGVALIIVAFVSVALPGMDELGRGGRGITKLIVTVLFFLGPFAPLVGMLLGFGGVALIVHGLKRVPRVVTMIGGGIISLLMLLCCGLSFLVAMDILNPTLNNEFAQSHVQQQKEMRTKFEEDSRKQQEAFDAQVKKDQEEFAQQGREMQERFDKQNQRMLDRVFSGGDGSADDDSGTSDNPARSRRASRRNRTRRGGFGGSDLGGSDRHTNLRAFADLHSRSIREGDKVFNLDDFDFSKSDVRLTFGEIAGQTERMGNVFYSGSPLEGIALATQGPATYTAPANPDEAGNWVTSIKDGEAIYGFNLNFQRGELLGIQAIFCDLNDGELDDSNLNTGQWVGQEADDDKFETVNGNGKLIYGYVIFKDGFSIAGFQLIVEK